MMSTWRSLIPRQPMGTVVQKHREATVRLRAMYIPNQSILPQAGTLELEDDQTQVSDICCRNNVSLLNSVSVGMVCMGKSEHD